MKASKRMKLHENWLLKASRDLKSSKILIKEDDEVLDISIYHTQQCAEKALKAYLVFREHPLEKTHDIEHLIEKCSKYDLEFNNLMDEAELLNPYSTQFRYPGLILDPEVDEVLEAIRVAEEILKFVEKKIE